MKIATRIVFVFMLKFLTLPSLYGQDQDKMVDSLAKTFTDYVEAIPREEIYIHTDREDYIAGENIWMKIYLFDRKSMKPADRSRIAYIEILNSENRPVVQKRFAICEGYGPGQLQLPDTLTTGDYSIRAYTNWMKNFLPYNSFMRNIRIYNATKKKGYFINTDSIQSPGQTNISNRNFQDSDLDLSFKTRRLDNNDLEVTFYIDDNFYLENGDQIYIFIQTHGNIDIITPVKVQGNKTVMLVPGVKLTPGINQITVFNSSGVPVAEKYNYTPSVQTGTLDVSIAGTRKTREKITLFLKQELKPSVASVSAILSVAVIPLPDSSDLTGIEDFLVFGTEFSFQNHLIHGYLADQKRAMIDSMLQNVSSNWIDWRNILAGKIPDLANKTESEEHFLSGRLEPADQITLMPSERVLLCMPGRYPELQHTETDSKGNFTFSLHIDEEIKDLVIMPDDHGEKSNILLEPAFSGRYQDEGKPVFVSEVSFSPIVDEMIFNHQIRRIYGIPGSGDLIKPVFQPLRPVRFYGKPDIELVLSDFVALPEMEEVFFELLPGISLKKRDENFEIMIADRIYDNRYELFPYLFIDGVKINDASIIADLNPADVERIDVVKEKYFIGDYFLPGILNVVTKKANFNSIPLPDYMIRFPYRVVEPALSFAMPDYSSADQKNSSLPDFRNTLYWNPSVLLDKEGKSSLEFWTSDLPGKYKIIVQGASHDGQIIYKEMIFTIE